MSETVTPDGTGARLGNKVTVGKWKGHSFYKWRASYIESGNRKKKGFKTRQAAEDWAEEREAEALQHGTGDSITAIERAAIVEHREELLKLGLSLRGALEHSIEYHRRLSKSSTVENLVSEVIESRRKAGRSKRYLQDMESRLGRFNIEFGHRSVATVTREEIADWLHELKLAPVTTNNFRRLLVVAFNDAIESRYCKDNPAEKVMKVKEIESEVGILTPEETRLLLESADTRILPAIALGAFAGLRTSELQSIKWPDVKVAAGHIRVRANSAKSSRNRLISLCEPLREWLSLCNIHDGLVWPRNGRVILDEARRRAGFGNPESLTDVEKKNGKELLPWPDNALRHSFASYHLAYHKNAGELALQMGHTDTKIIFRHYRELVTQEEAEAFWAIKPNRVDNVVPIRKTA